MVTHNSHTIDAERQVVGIVLREPSAFDHAELMPNHFAEGACQAAWEILTALRDAGQLTGDTTIFVREAKRWGVLGKIGGAAAVARFVTEAGSSTSITVHADDVRRGSELRRLRALAESLLERVNEPSADLGAIRAKLDADLHTSAECRATARPIAEVMADVLRNSESQTELPGVPTGIPSLDHETAGGLQPGELIVLAARPSVGKSALAVGMAMHAALLGHRVLLISLEMRSEDIALRVLASETGEPLQRLRAGKGDRYRAATVAAEFDEVPFLLWSGRDIDLDRLRGVCRLEQSRGGLAAVFVDYIGLIRPTNSRKPRWEAVTETSNALKSMALTLNIPVVALCQLNRDAEGEKSKLSHLRGSGAIEQDADIVLLLDRDRQSTSATLRLAKIRNGRTGEIDLSFDGPAFKFSEMSDEFDALQPHEEFAAYQS